MVKQQSFLSFSPILVLLIAVLGLTTVFDNGFQHEVVYHVLFITGLFTVYYLIKGSAEIKLPQISAVFLLVFFIVTGTSVIWSVDRHLTLQEIYLTSIYIMLFYLTGTLSKEDIRKLAVFVVLLGTGVSLVGLLVYTFVKVGRILSVFVNPNPLGMFLAMTALVGFGIYLENIGSKKLAVALVLLLSGLVLSGSRGSIIAFCLSFPFVLLSVPREYLLQMVKRSAAIFIFTGVFVYLLTICAPWIQRLEVITNTIETMVIRADSFGYLAVGGRLTFWQVAWRMISEYPLTGLGLGTFPLTYNFFKAKDYFWSMYTHNHYLQLWAEAGLFALVGFLGFIVTLYWVFIKRGLGKFDGVYWGLFAGGLAFSMHIFMDFTWNIPAVTMLFWIFLGAITALQNYHSIALTKLYRTVGVLVVSFILAASFQQFVALKISQTGHRYANVQDYSAATASFEKAVKIYPLKYFEQLAVYYGLRYQFEGDPLHLEKAVAHGKRSIEQSPYNYLNYEVVGRLLEMKGSPEVEDYLTKAIKYCGFKPSPYKHLGYYLLSQGRVFNAVDVFIEGIEQYPFALINAPTAEEKDKVMQEGLEIHLGLAKAYEDINQPEKAHFHLEKVLEIDQDNPVAKREIVKYQRISM